MRAWAFYRRYGHELERMSEHAVLNANYLRHKITKQASNGNQSGAFTEGAPASVVKHEFIEHDSFEGTEWRH